MLIGGRIFLPDEAFEWEFMLSSGPGGQHVNKSSTAARLRFDIARTPYLNADDRELLLHKLAARLTAAGELCIVAQGERSQLMNRRAALTRLEELLETALKPVRRRRPTRPTAGSVERRLTGKAIRSRIKKFRRPPKDKEEGEN